MTRFALGFLRGSSSAFTPLDVSGAQRGYDAGLSSYSGGTWQDLTGNSSVIQATESRRPAFNATGINGQPSLQFNGSTHFLQSSSVFMRSSTNLTVIVVARGAPQANKILVSEGHGTNTNAIYAPIQSTTTGALNQQSCLIRRDDFTTVINTSGQVVWDDTARFHGIKINQTAQTVTFFRDLTDSTAVPFTNTLGTINVNLFSIGCLLRSGPTNHWAGELGALWIYNTIVSAGDLEDIRLYYAGRGYIS